MANETKGSARGNVVENPEPSGPPGTRSGQRGTVEQLKAHDSATAVLDDPATEWERSEQDKLPPRGTGSQQNQGEDHGPTVAEPQGRALEEGAAEATPALDDAEGLQTGGRRGDSNQSQSGDGTKGAGGRHRGSGSKSH